MSTEIVAHFIAGYPDRKGSLETALGLADGGAVFCYLTHDLSDELGSTEVVRLSSSGSTVWHISLNLEGFERLAVCQEGPDGRILLAGNSHRYVPEDFRTWLVELDADGQELRNMTANTASFRSRIWSACRAWDGGLFWAGSDLDPATSEHEAWVVRTDWSWFTPPDPH